MLDVWLLKYARRGAELHADSVVMEDLTELSAVDVGRIATVGELWF